MNRNLPRWIINLPKVTDTLMTIDERMLKLEQASSKQIYELTLMNSAQRRQKNSIKNQGSSNLKKFIIFHI